MKFKAGLLVGYNGEGYSGLQLNKDLNTIEKTIGECLAKIGAISEANSKDLSKIHICSSSRTDKGVHAVLNLVVCKIQKEINDLLQDSLSNHLQEKGIHLYKILRLTKSFVPSKQTAYRTYEYVIPTYFLKEGDFSKEIVVREEPANPERLKAREYFEKDIKDVLGHKASQEDLEVFKKIVMGFEGTRFYHNYTVLSNPKGKQRFIQRVEVSDPYVVDDIEYIRITLDGQSFLLHQIRKMTYFALLLTKYKRKNYTSIFEESFSTSKVHIPKGPSQYLLLDRPHFMNVKDKGKMIENLEVSEDERLAFKKDISKLIHRKENLFRFLACLDSTRWYHSEMPYLK
ncbi:tRNA pseudouridine synthase 1 [Nosema granulosis]|uniref:tRNA pseudouridine synthase 1 n=1 Tax=Nosema granulosis TaxID=83296 RepID=A0A9P6GWJ4_9MICR|nr:tRNA pseudouridine synthase 1 [Nosema granulosis]